MTAGVRQRAILSPLLFNLYCNNIPEPRAIPPSLYTEYMSCVRDMIYREASLCSSILTISFVPTVLKKQFINTTTNISPAYIFKSLVQDKDY